MSYVTMFYQEVLSPSVSILPQPDTVASPVNSAPAEGRQTGLMWANSVRFTGLENSSVDKIFQGER